MKLHLPPLNVLSTYATTHESGDNVSASEQTKPSTEGMSADEILNQILLDSPEISAPTLLNLIRARGLKVSDEDAANFILAKQKPASAKGFLQLLKMEGVKIHEAMKQTAAKGVDVKKYDRCVAKVKKAGTADNPYAVCNATLQQAKLSKKMRLKASISGTSFPAVQRSKVKESWRLDFVKFRESAAVDDGIGPTRFHVILIKEGLGNLRDGYFYSEKALESAVSVFEGKKCYANHPSDDEERTRPERDVRDIIGHFENVRLGEDQSGAAQLEADLVILPNKAFEWARGQIAHSVDYSKKFPDKDFVGLSINASGDAEPMDVKQFMSQYEVPETSKPKIEEAVKNGLNTVRVVNVITDAVSCDLVTEAGAGGRIVSIIK